MFRGLRLGKRLSILLACIIAGTLSAPAFGLLVRPILLELTATGQGTSGAIEVVNDRNRPIAVEIKVQSLSIPEVGAPVLAPDPKDGADYMIFPAIASIPAFTNCPMA